MAAAEPESDPPDRTAHPRHRDPDDCDGASRASLRIDSGGRRGRGGDWSNAGGASALDRHLSRDDGDRGQRQRHRGVDPRHCREEASGIYSTCSSQRFSAVEDVGRGRRGRPTRDPDAVSRGSFREERRGGDVESVASSLMGSTIESDFSRTSSLRHQSDYSRTSSLRHRIKQHAFLKKNALPLAVAAALVLGSIV